VLVAFGLAEIGMWLFGEEMLLALVGYVGFLSYILSSFGIATIPASRT
jgi:hypothetical protein